MTKIFESIKPFLLFLPFCVGVFLGADDQTKVVTILPEIMIDFEIPIHELGKASWLVTAYLIGYTAVMPFIGRVSDKYGYRTTFLVALIVFMIGSAATAISPELSKIGGGSPNMGWIIGTRVLQSLGGGALIPISIAAAGYLIPRNKHAIAYGLIGASAEAGGVIGPLFGGAVTEFLNWRWAFWLNIPLTLATIIFLFKCPKGNKYPVKLDFAGAIIFASFLAFLTGGLAQIGKDNNMAIILIIVSIFSLILTIVRHKTNEYSIIPRNLLRKPGFSASNITHLFIGAALIIAMVTVPVMAQTLFSESPLEGGLKLLRLTIALSIGAFLGGVLTQKFGTRIPCISGLIMTTLGFYFMSNWGIDPVVKDPWMSIHLSITGFGFGLCIAPIMEAALDRVKSSERGSASSILTVSRMMGQTFGLATLTAWGTSRFSKLTEDMPEFSLDPFGQQKFTEAALAAGEKVFQGFFLVGAIVSIIGIIPAIMMSKSRRNNNK